MIVTPSAQANDAFWLGGPSTGSATTAAWSTQNVTSPSGWIGALPDAIGDSANFDTTGKASTTTTQDSTSGRTVGKIEIIGTGNDSWQITLASGKNLTLNQDGAGSGTAIISDAMTGGAGNSSILMNGSAGIITLNDDLLISNTSVSTRAGGSIEIDPQFQGTGNITFYSVSNTVGAGQIALFRTGAGPSNFIGNSTIAKGAVSFSRGDRFSPNPGNIITIGRSDGAASLIYSNTTLGNMENNFATSATAGGTLLFGTNNAATGLVNFKSTNSFAASFTLNGDLSFTSGNGGGTLQIGDPIVGVGAVTKVGAGPMRVTNANSYYGGTVVNAGSLSVGHTDAINNGFGFYVATDGTLGSGDVTVNNTASHLELESSSATINVIADSAAVNLAGGGGGNGTLMLDTGVNDTIGGLVLGGVTQTVPGTYGSSASGATFQNDNYFSGPGVVTLALTRTLYWDTNGIGANAGGAMPTGNWDGSARNFNTDSTGAGGGTITATSLSTDPVVFTGASDGTGIYPVTISGTQSAASVTFARGNVTLTGGTLNTGTFNVASGATGTISTTITGGASGSITKHGPGPLILTQSQTVTSSVAVTGGTLQLQDVGTNQNVIHTPSVSVTAGQLDLTNNKLIVTTPGSAGTPIGGVYTPGSVQGMIQAGRNGGAWNGSGIVTSESPALGATALTTLATAVAGDIGVTTLGGQPVATTDTLVMYTYDGDMTLDGQINGDDYFRIDNGFANHLTGYENGDLNYDGRIDADDYFIIDANYGKQSLGIFPSAGAPFSPGAIVAVPEPASLAIVIAAAGLMRRRRRG